MNDPKFVKDRGEFMGTSWAKFVFFRGMFCVSEQRTSGKTYLGAHPHLSLHVSPKEFFYFGDQRLTPEPCSVTLVLSLKKYC